jgi:4-aminobutyrate aminotransferase-like enzyme
MRTAKVGLARTDWLEDDLSRPTAVVSSPTSQSTLGRELLESGEEEELIERDDMASPTMEVEYATDEDLRRTGDYPSSEVRPSHRMTAQQQVRNLYGGHELVKDLVVAVDAAGIYVRDDEGREYIDCASGTFDQPLGYRHPAVTQAMKRQIDELAYIGSPFFGKTLLELADKLVSVAPPNLTRVHLRDLTGSTAIEGAIKMAQAYTGKRDVITMFTSHHGQTSFTTSLSGNSFRRALYPMNNGAGTLHVPAANCYRCFYKQSYPSCNMRCVDGIRDFIEFASSGSVAALVVEPIQGNGGNIIPPRDYFKKLKALCDEYGIIMIFDEVQTGMGRLGTMFAAEYFDVQPHMMVLAKGLSGPAPRGAILLEERLEKMPRYQHSFTGGSSLISAAAALATIEVMEQPGFLEEVRRVGGILGERLMALKDRHPFIGDVRGVGMMWGLEIVNPDGSPNNELCNRIAHDGRDFGLMLRTSRYGYGNVVKMRPPLIITEPQVNEVMSRFGRLLDSVS